MSYRVRPAVIGDISQLEEIEKDGFPTSWPLSSFRRDLQNNKKSILVAYQDWEMDSSDLDQASSQKHYPFLSILLEPIKKLTNVITGTISSFSTGGFIAGYIATWFIADEAHITAIAVRSGQRGQGLGELLLMGSVEQAVISKAKTVTLEVRVSNNIAQSLYEKYGFKYVGIRKRYYTDNNEDAHIMTTDNISTSSYSAMLNTLQVSYEESHKNKINFE